MPLKLNNKTAFSLIELSVVILIIGVIVAGVTQSSRLISSFKLNNARALTQSSPVASITGLMAWFDTTREESLLQTIEDGDDILTWKNSNPQRTDIITLTSSSAKEPQLKADGIGGLPSLNFDYTSAGKTSMMMISNTIKFGANYTMFLVFKPVTVGSAGQPNDFFTIVNSSTNAHGVLLEIQTNATLRALHRSPTGGAGGDGPVSSSPNLLVTNRNYIFSYVRNFDTTYANIWMNNTKFINNASATNGVFTTDMLIQIGQITPATASRLFDGLYSEIIIFDRSLKQEEIDSVETYLSKKYSITLS